ncbi:MAG: hypothetical protein AAGH40_14455 [Verrucomicrobiota bacterium]
MPSFKSAALLIFSFSISVQAHDQTIISGLPIEAGSTGQQFLERKLPFITYPEDTQREGFIYQSENFRFASSQTLSPNLIGEIEDLCEATYKGLSKLPLNLLQTDHTKRFEVSLFLNQADYLKAGGIKGTGGIYLPLKERTLIRLDLLTEQIRNSGDQLCKRKSKILVHEITHQAQHQWLGKMPTWLLEGIAVYMESIPYKDGEFDFEAAHFRDSEGVNHCTTNRLSVTNLETLMSMSGREWIEDFKKNPKSVHRNYLSAYLLTYYFLHMEGDGSAARIKKYFHAMKHAFSQHDRLRAKSSLMDGKTVAELEADLIAAYENEGMRLVPINGYLLSRR